jgi:hypothetical protein
MLCPKRPRKMEVWGHEAPVEVGKFTAKQNGGAKTSGIVHVFCSTGNFT